MAAVQRLAREGTTMAPYLRKLSVCGGLTARVRTRSQAGPPHAAVAPQITCKCKGGHPYRMHPGERPGTLSQYLGQTVHVTPSSRGEKEHGTKRQRSQSAGREFRASSIEHVSRRALRPRSRRTCTRAT